MLYNNKNGYIICLVKIKNKITKLIDAHKSTYIHLNLNKINRFIHLINIYN